MRAVYLIVIAAIMGASVALAQDGGVKRLILQRADVPGTALETVIGTAEMAPGASTGRHRHRGVELGYVAAGELEMVVEGESPKRLHAGDSYRVDAGKVHDARNVGAMPAKAVATWVVEKGKPLAEPAP